MKELHSKQYHWVPWLPPTNQATANWWDERHRYWGRERGNSFKQRAERSKQQMNGCRQCPALFHAVAIYSAVSGEGWDQKEHDNNMLLVTVLMRLCPLAMLRHNDLAEFGTTLGIHVNTQHNRHSVWSGTIPPVAQQKALAAVCFNEREKSSDWHFKV